MVARYRNSVVGLLDILGVSERLSDPVRAKPFAEAIAAVFQPMIGDKGEWCFVLPHVDEAREIEVFLSGRSAKGLRVSFISDSIVVSVPVDSTGEGDRKSLAILTCLETIKALQQCLLILGLRSRGGIAIGGLIHSGELIVGDGLVKAHEIERRQAINPRTVVDSTVVDYLIASAQEHAPVYLNSVAHALRQDEDGVFFVDYLSYSPSNGYWGIEAEFENICHNIERELEEEKSKPWISKMVWLQKYVLMSYGEYKSKTIEPFSHAKSVFRYTFRRTSETLVSFMESEADIDEFLKAHDHAYPDALDRGRPLWPLGWSMIRDDELKERLNAELSREVPDGHVLYGRSASVLGRLSCSDDYLFWIGDGRVAQVHLTWTVETQPKWPETTIHPSFFVWAAQRREMMTTRKMTSAVTEAKG